MSRSLFKTFLAIMALAAVSVGTANATPAHHGAQSARSLVQPVHWVHRGHHRVWVADHHHHR